MNQAIHAYAKQNNFSFVSLTDLSGDPINMALSKDKDPGVKQHPSDKGMRLIATESGLVVGLTLSKVDLVEQCLFQSLLTIQAAYVATE